MAWSVLRLSVAPTSPPKSRAGTPVLLSPLSTSSRRLQAQSSVEGVRIWLPVWRAQGGSMPCGPGLMPMPLWVRAGTRMCTHARAIHTHENGRTGTSTCTHTHAHACTCTCACMYISACTHNAWRQSRQHAEGAQGLRRGRGTRGDRKGPTAGSAQAAGSAPREPHGPAAASPPCPGLWAALRSLAGRWGHDLGPQ